jgi:hypothetical protein
MDCGGPPLLSEGQAQAERGGEARFIAPPKKTLLPALPFKAKCSALRLRLHSKMGKTSPSPGENAPPRSSSDIPHSSFSTHLRLAAIAIAAPLLVYVPNAMAIADCLKVSIQSLFGR